MASTGKHGRGPRPKGAPSARDALLDAGLVAFARDGYARASIREIAAGAGVDSALLYHYYGSKRGLFREVIASRMTPPDLPAEELRRESVDDMARRLIRLFLARWGEGAEARPLVALLRSATADAEAARVLREVLEQVLIPHVQARLGEAHARLRAGLGASQLLGLGLLRYVVELPPVSTLPLEELATCASAGLAAALCAVREGGAG